MTRNVLLHLVDSQVLFKGFSSRALNAHYGLDTAIMSSLEAPFAPNSGIEADAALSEIRQVLTRELNLSASLIDDADCLAAARVSEIVGTRGCRLSACAIAATVIQTGGDAKEWPHKDKKLIFGLDGSLVEFYPRFEQRVRDALREILGDEVQQRIEIVLAKDGSGVGGQSSLSSSFPLALSFSFCLSDSFPTYTAALCAQAAQAMEEKGAATVTKE